MSTLITGGDFAARKAKAAEICPEAIFFAGTRVEDIRDLERLVRTGVSVILENAQNLTVEAQNAFLKTLEEPPAGVQIILLAQNEDQLLETVVSRCFLITLNSPNALNPLNLDANLEKLSTLTDRQEALKIIDQILLTKPLPRARKLLAAKKYLQANCNVKLTLETLFANC